MPNPGKVDFLFVINHKVKKEQILEIEKFFRNVDRQYIVTKTRDEAVAKIAHLDAEKRFKTAVAVGGDGTVNAVVNGLMRHQNGKTFGVIPLGTGNDFAKSLNLPKTIEENCRVLLANADAAEPIDVGKINSVHFINVASVGIDALAAKLAEAAPFWKKIHPFFYYAAGLVKAILRYKPIYFKIVGGQFAERTETELGRKEKFLLAAFANGKNYGGNFPIAPQAKTNDGKLVLCAIEAMPALKILRNLPKLLAGKHGELEEVKFSDFERVLAATNADFFQADGEIFSCAREKKDGYDLYNRCEVKIIPAGLKMIKNAAVYEFSREKSRLKSLKLSRQ